MQQARGAELGLNPLVASYGPALLDRAILDALGKATGQSFAVMISTNTPGITATELTPDTSDVQLQPFLAGLKPGTTIDLRHTVGLVDPLTAADRPAAERVYPPARGARALESSSRHGPGQTYTG